MMKKKRHKLSVIRWIFYKNWQSMVSAYYANELICAYRSSSAVLSSKHLEEAEQPGFWETIRETYKKKQEEVRQMIAVGPTEKHKEAVRRFLRSHGERSF